MATAMWQPEPKQTHEWEHQPGYRSWNYGLGGCNTGSGKRIVCALGGIGCDVDHIAIARAHLIAAGFTYGAGR